MCTIILKDLLSNKSYPDAGDALFKLCVDCVNNSENIIIDMESVDSLPSMFLNTSIGAFIDKYGKDKLRSTMRFTRITRLQADRLKSYLDKY